MKFETAHAIVAAIIADLTDRSGLQNAWEDCDEEIQDEIRDRWVQLVMASESLEDAAARVAAAYKRKYEELLETIASGQITEALSRRD